MRIFVSDSMPGLERSFADFNGSVFQSGHHPIERTRAADAERSRTRRAQTWWKPMKRRKFVVGLGSLAAGASAAMGTGAFTSQTASRDLSVSVASDNPSAYLSLFTLGHPNSNAFTSTSGNELVIDVSDNGNGGSGINVDGHTRIDNLFGVKNQGTQDVWAYFRFIGNGAKTQAYLYDSDNQTKALSRETGQPVSNYDDQGEPDPLLPDPSDIEHSARRLSVGEVLRVGLDVEEVDNNIFQQTETIQAVGTADPSQVSNFPPNAHDG